MTVLYIGGAGRSGSTLLEHLLSAMLGATPVGELRFFWRYFTRGGVLCGCGVHLPDCPFWQGVATLLADEGVDVAAIADLSHRYDRTRRLLLPRGTRPPLPLIAATARLYAAVAECVGGGLVVDNSKAPTHLAVLRRIPGLDLCLVHLVRDARAVAFSWNQRVKRDPAALDRDGRMPRRSTLVALGAWALENLGIEAVARPLARRTRLRYERLASDPHRAVRELVDVLKLDAGRSPQRRDRETMHTVGGNPVRFESELNAIRLDRAWRDATSTAARWFQGGLVAPLLWRYGYRLGGAT